MQNWKPATAAFNYIYILYVKPIWQGIGEYIIKLK